MPTAADRWEALSGAHRRAHKHAWYRTPEYLLPEVIGGRLRARNRAFRVAVARGELTRHGRRVGAPCACGCGKAIERDAA